MHQKLSEFKSIYNRFQKSEAYQERLNNFCIVPIAKDIISETLKNEPLTNEHLTGLIHMFRWDCSDENFDKYLNQNVQDKIKREEITERADECGEYGYTGGGLRAVRNLTKQQLTEVKHFLLRAFTINDVDSAIRLIEEYDALKIPFVTKGIYSPWLYYINPTVFPIINNQHTHFLNWLGVSGNYSDFIEPYAMLKDFVDEEELGPLDKMTYEFEKYNQIETAQFKPMQSLNTILYGPPGTGKTYNTIDKAVAIADADFYSENKSNRSALTRRFNELLIKDFDKLEGQIAFCTFHQSMSYEDFVEGIKPQLESERSQVAIEAEKMLPDTAKHLSYSIKDGIFKIIARMAADALEQKETPPQQAFSLSETDFNQALFYKMSLGNTAEEEDNGIYEYCIKNNCIALGWGGNIDYRGMDQIAVNEAAKKDNQPVFSIQQINMFIHYVKNGNYVIISNGNLRFRAIGQVTGDYEYNPATPVQYQHFRKVEWLLKDVDLPVADIYSRSFQQQTLYKLKQQEIKREFFVPAPAPKKAAVKKEPLNYVLIIDEINRGNVSAIFGELITLIEDDKRTGKDEALTVTLPYSKKIFSVPPNLYIIGTMNTADRSVEALDTALRRRFVFEQKGPEPELLSPAYLLMRFYNMPEYFDIDWDAEPFASSVKGLYDMLGTSIAIEEIVEEQDFDEIARPWELKDFKVVDTNSFTGINLQLLLEAINKRLTVLLSKDYTIGHAWLMNVYSLNDLKQAFKNKILPLLQEYFYNNYAKMDLVLGDTFVKQEEVEENLFAKSSKAQDEAGDYSGTNTYTLISEEEIDRLSIDDFKSIYA